MKWTDEFLDQYRLIEDPVADELVARMVKDYGPEKAKGFFEILIRNITIPFDKVPDYVKDYIDRMALPAPGTDLERVKRGQKVFADFGPEMALMLYFKSLPTSYLNWRGVQVLHITGRMAEKRAWPEVFARRIGETTQFLMDVMNPGSLDPRGEGVHTVLKVRLVHASVRYFISKSPKWNEAEWQKPINQEELVFTLLTFSLVMAQGLEQLKIDLPKEQAEDFLYAWSVVGHYLGIFPELIPANMEDAAELQERIHERQFGESDAGKEVAKALTDFAKEIMIPGKTMYNTPDELVRFFMGPTYSNMLGVEDHTGCLSNLIPVAFQKSFGMLNKMEDKSKGFEKIGNKLGLLVLRGFIKRFKSVKGRGLVIPEEMAKAWGV